MGGFFSALEMRAFSLLLLVLSWGELGDPSGFLPSQ